MSGNKFDQGKPSLDLIPVEFSIGVGKAFGFGKEKYGQHNFRSGIYTQKLLAAAKRHIDLELARIDVDDESGCEHWMNAAASIAMYCFMKYHRPEFDDRYDYTEEEKKRIVELMYGKRLSDVEFFHKKCLKEIERLIDLQPDPHSDDGKKLLELATIVAKYEKEKYS